MPALKLSKPTVAKEAKKYLAECVELKKVPLFKELAFRLHISADTLTDYTTRKGYREHLMRVKEAQEVGLNRKLIDENKPIGSIFLLKTQHGYRENDNINLNVSGQLGVVMLPSKNGNSNATTGK